MRVLSWDDFTGRRSLKHTRISLTIGVFDGIHLGHQRLLDKIISSQKEESAVLTFRYNPRRFLKPHLFPGDITTMEQKLSLLDDLGIDTVLLIDFSNDFSKLTGRDFLMSIYRSCRLELLVLGDNFRCGYQGDTSAYDARDILSGYQVEVDIEPGVTLKGATLSSTRIRAAIREGDVEEAAEMMNRPFILDVASALLKRDGKSRRVDKIGLQQVLPPPGRYLVDIVTHNSIFKDELVIDHQEVVWDYDKNDETKAIKFLRKLEEGA
ncbi:MAG: FAD synthetase family protein [Spirochaetia bacterium]